MRASKEGSSISQGKEKVFTPFGEVLTENGCKVTLNFLPKSNGEAIETVKKILISSQHQEIPHKAESTG
jgi:hypothetical protein